jgi:hypothetical protein
VAAKHDKDSAISLIRTTLKGWHCLRYTQSTNAELRYPKPQTPRKGVIHNQQLDAVTTKEERQHAEQQLAQVPPPGLPVRCSSLYPFTRSGSLRNSAYITLLILFVPPRGWCFLRPCHELQVILSSQQTRNSVSQPTILRSEFQSYDLFEWILFGIPLDPDVVCWLFLKVLEKLGTGRILEVQPWVFLSPPPPPKKFSPLMPKTFMPIPRGAGTLFGTILGVSEE